MTQNEMRRRKLGVRDRFYGHSELAEDAELRTMMTTPFEGPRGWFDKVIACLSTCHNVKLVSSGAHFTSRVYHRRRRVF
jgi:hypothetical protein